MDYQDGALVLDAAALTIRRYYFPWGGSKHVPLAAIRSVERVPLSVFGGRGRVWGSTTLRYWANLDPRRPRKDTGFVFDLGHHVRPLVTPDDPDAFETALRAVLPQTPIHVSSRPPYGA